MGPELSRMLPPFRFATLFSLARSVTISLVNFPNCTDLPTALGSFGKLRTIYQRSCVH